MLEIKFIRHCDHPGCGYSEVEYLKIQDPSDAAYEVANVSLGVNWSAGEGPKIVCGKHRQATKEDDD